MPRLARIAIQTALGHGGVAVLTLPGDVLHRPATHPTGHSALTVRPSVVMPPEELDHDPARLGRRTPLELAIHGDITATLRAVLPLLRQKTDRSFLDRMLHQHENALTDVVDAYTHNVEHRVPIHPEYAARILDDLAAEDAVFTQTQPHRQAVHHQPSRHRRPRL
jgi:thiamine pyrophosphate-dependent acetolactate synthase large subunit-like protein